SFITRFARYYTPTVVFSALCIAFLPPILIDGAVFHDWVYRALTFLVISCPCALVISIPLSFFGGMGGASKMGILVKGGNYLEALAQAEVVVFDKTGTLTKGSYAVTDICVAGEQERERAKEQAKEQERAKAQALEQAQTLEQEQAKEQAQELHTGGQGWSREQFLLLELAALAESYSDHPVSLSLRKAYSKAADLSRVGKVVETPGFGVEAEIDGETVYVGNRRLLEESAGIRLADYAVDFVAGSSEGEALGTAVYVAKQGVYLGHILISDEIKETAAAAISSLKAVGIKQTVMLTGDTQSAGQQISAQLGIDQVYAGLLPEGKVDIVERLLSTKSGKGKLAFVGDGINDAPALARADVGVAMGALGTEAAIEAADVVIMDDDPARLVAAIRNARKTLAIARQNTVFSLGVKGLVLVLGAMGYASMWAAVFADVGVMVIAILNALRALRV
ncbi:MAG: heavy metal translocating P-type ATPase, partial [Clostridiales bacterium]|nr:heavy metal translocating P-type ATPase [Clostridiales bacterium]